MSVINSRATIGRTSGASAGRLAMPRAGRCDTLIASVVLVLLIAGWALNFVSVKQLTLGLGNYLMFGLSRQA